MILPIGNTGSIRRLPYATLSLILLMGIVFFAMQPSLAVSNEEVLKAYGEYVNLVAKNMEQRGMDSFNSELLSEEIEEPTVEEGDSLYEEIRDAKKAFEESNANHPFSKWGVSRKNFSPITILSSIFVHGDIFHLAGNLWFLALLGFNVEDIYGRLNYLIFFILSGVFSSMLFLASASDANISLIGASGAISGVMGAFLVKLYRTKIKFFYWLFPVRPLYGTFMIFAGFCLPLWFIQQVVESASDPSSGVAFIAHVGGFLFGVIVSLLLIATKIEERFISPKVEEASNLLGMNNDEQEGVSAFLENDFEKSKSLLKPNFDRKRTFAVFVPLFVSLAKSGEEKEAQRRMDIYLRELYAAGEKDKISEIYEDLSSADAFSFASSASKIITAKTMRDKNNPDAARKIMREVCEKERYTVAGFKALISAYEGGMEFEGIDALAGEYIENGDDESYDLKETLKRRMNEQR